MTWRWLDCSCGRHLVKVRGPVTAHRVEVSGPAVAVYCRVCKTEMFIAAEVANRSSVAASRVEPIAVRQ